MPARYDVTPEDLGDLLTAEPAFRVRQVWDGLHRRFLHPGEMTDLPLAVRRQLEHELPPALTEHDRQTADGGDTVKWSFALADGARIETVLMTYPDRVTVCVSSQAGCAMGCTFCATGQAGFTRHLTRGEIVEQVVVAAREAAPRRLSRVVFMGMGEPLANYDRVMAAVRRLHGDVGLSARHLTISTVGLVPGIDRLAGEGLPVTLAVSLHAANDELRDSMVPMNRRYPLRDLTAACARWVEATGRRLSFEWACIAGVNDRSTDVRELATLARSLGAHVNLIPLNPTPGYPVRGSLPTRVRALRDELADLGVRATVRDTRGADIAAACGQLASTAPVAVNPGTPGRRAGAVP